MTYPADSAQLIEHVAALAKTDLVPVVNAVDQDGFYPEAFLRQLGDLGGFRVNVPVHLGGLAFGLANQIDVIREVGRVCGSTAFLVWCQTTCALYLNLSANAQVRERYLPAVAAGTLLSGTGMSNTVKHLAGIENIHLKARREDGAYVVSGSLPWVSNVGPDHLAIVAAAVQDGGYVMFAVQGNAQGVSLHPCPEFSGLEGTQTLNIRMKDVRVADADVLAHPDQFKDYIARIKPSFIMGQLGMGFGVIDCSLRTIQESNRMSAHVNQFLDDQGDDLAQEAARLFDQARQVAQQPSIQVLDALRLRLATSELTLRAANSALLHAGAKGYLKRHPAQRRLREAMFVAIVTPALKHLRKEIHALEQVAA